jgi:hypothetical protein
MDNKDLQSNKLPQIDIKDKNLPVITKRAWDALIASNSPPYLFTFGNTAVRLVTGENGQIFTDRLGKNKLRHELARCAIFRTIKKGELEIDLPPLYVVNDLLAHPNYPLPRLSRIVNAPIFSKEGKLHLTPGYSPSTECYFNLDERVQIPKVPMIPSEGDVKRAKETIAEILCDFPFISESEIANAISLYLSRFVCGMISGPSPVYVIEAPSPGNGKTLLAQVLAYPSTGKIIEAMSEGRNDEEMRKRITAKLMNSPNFVFIDNVRNHIAYSSLAAAITAGVWEDRILGVSRTVRVPVTSTWVITGNNPSLSSEMARRCVRIRIDTGREQPWMRDPSEFKHPDLLQWVKMNRGQLIWAGLVLVQNWIANGRPMPVNKNMGMFEQWCQVMGGILEINGIKGFLDNMNDMYCASDIEISLWRSLTQAWWKAFGEAEIGAAELYQLVLEKDIAIELGSGSDRSQKIRLGIQISKMRQRKFGQLRIVFAKQQNHAQKYRLEQVQGV